MQLSRRVLIERDPRTVFDLVSDPSRYGDFFAGLTRWEPRTRKRKGIGARYRVLMKVGSIAAGGVVRITAWRPGEEIAWVSDAGVEQRGRWVLHSVSSGTELCLQIEFHLGGGPAGWLVERLAGRVVERNMMATLLAARAMLEFEPPKGTARQAAGRASA